MKTTIKQLTLSVAAAVIAGPVLFGMSATAGDWGGGLKGMRGSYVPVPAPAPIPDFHPKWYLRADVGLGIGVNTQASESGAQYGVGETTENLNAPGGAFGFGGFNSDEGSPYGSSIGFGAGYYYSRNFRIDLTGELRSDKSHQTTGSFQYVDVAATGAAAAAAGASGDDRVNGTVYDKTTQQSAIFMANAYYDMNRFGRWKPYIGGGLGFAVNDVRRTHNTTLTSCETFTANDCDTPNAAAGYSSRTERQYVYTLAANLTAGVSYQISNVTSLDFNYRYLYVGGTDAAVNINGNASTIDIEDQHEHYLRAGLRFDIN